MLEPVLIQGIQPGGQLTITTDVENWPGEASIMGPDLMVKMEAHARETGAEIDLGLHLVGSTCPTAPSPRRPTAARPTPPTR